MNEAGAYLFGYYSMHSKEQYRSVAISKTFNSFEEFVGMPLKKANGIFLNYWVDPSATEKSAGLDNDFMIGKNIFALPVANLIVENKNNDINAALRQFLGRPQETVAFIDSLGADAVRRG